ncbi:LOW QUALITY PROTEIN: interferon-induced very large GTPase 1-like [Lethenteron reissneri]|uniref:LOW QUALITY PROTEIN: interferon-induced very large GTPase 1-like n=1 Tax=Lethenteron reissneri TaxID=7753 RepID=UPI002AB739FC|nr:LOW QUALITY PROTEIN: interferon-induced very large GTPase 1-like [Lethenteron reissneri]
MAPPNPSYCQNVKDLKEMLLSISKRGKNVLKISEFKARIQDLWRALLTENFLFSFKNTLEIAAYSKLEEMYGKWTWSLRSHLIQEENKQYNIINNSTDVTSNLTRSMIEKSVLPKYNETRKEIETYFKGEDAELLTQWKTNFANRFETIKEDLVIDTYKKCTDLIEQKSALNSVDQNRSRYEDQLMKKCKDLASKLNTTDVKDVQLEKEFDTMWEESMDEVKNSVLAPKILNFRIEVQNILQKEFQIENGISTNVEKMFHNESREIQRNGIWDWLPFSRYQEQTNIFKKITEDAENAANVVIKHIENRKLGYNENNIHEVIKCVQETVDSCCEHNAKLKLTNTNRLDLAICILTNAEWKFQKIHDDFQRANDPLIYFSSKKEEYFNSFKIRCKGATNTTIFADTLCSKLKAAMHQAVCDQASLYIVDKMKSECQAFNGNRSRLQNYILIHLAEKEMFEEFNEYIQKPQQYFVKYITERVEEYCSAKENNKINKILKSCLELQKKLVVNVIADATTAVQTNKGDASSWLDEFSKRLDHKFNFPRHGLVIADYKDINDIAYLTDELTKAMETMVTQLNTQYSTASLRDLEHVRNKPHDMLCEQMSGCWAQCPFCDSLCTNTILNHAEDHCTPIHRPQAVTGWSWHETNFFCTDICTSLVASDILYVLPDGKIMPYKDYRTIGREHASWSITPDLTVQPYWKWFVCRFKSDLEEFYNLQFKGSGAIPDGWTKITKDEAIADLHKK